MKVKIRQSGDELIIPIPEAWVEQLNLHDGDEIELSLVDGQLVIYATDKGKKKFDLEALLEQMTDKNLHGEVDFGAPVGDEVW